LSCDVCIDADVSNVGFFYERTQTARKEHRCEECREVIPVGTRYDVVGGRYEGAMWNEKICLHCHEIARAWYCNGTLYGNIWEDIEYTFDELTSRSECFRKLSLPAQNHLLKFWWKWKERTA
jgi:hypothetical protein